MNVQAIHILCSKIARTIFLSKSTFFLEGTLDKSDAESKGFTWKFERSEQEGIGEV